MRFHEPFDDVLGSRTKVRVLRLRVLVGGEHSGWAIARSTAVGHKRCLLALEQLVQLGVVSRRRAGRTHLFGVLRDHYVVSELLAPLFARERESIEQAIELVRRGVGADPASVILHGSVARGEERPQSDLDLIVVMRSSADVGSRW